MIRFLSDAGVSYTESSYYDVRTMSTGTFIASMKSDAALSINTRPLAFTTDTVKLKVGVASPGNYKITFSDQAGFIAAKEIMMVDTYTGNTVNAKLGTEYSFSVTSDPASQGLNRFKMIFASAPIALRSPGTITLNNMAGTNGNYASFAADVYSRTGVYFLNYSNTPGSYFNIGTTPVKVIATDLYGNADSSVFDVIIKDVEKPMFNSVNTVYLFADTNTCGRSFTPATPIANDNSGKVCVTGSRSDGAAMTAMFPQGSTTITWKAADSTGNFVTMTQVINVSDNTTPIAQPKPAVQLESAFGVAGYPVMNNLLDIVFTDNCVLAVKNSFNNSNTLQGALLPVGKSIINWTATDAAGNSATASQEITVSDRTPPVITPANSPAQVSVNNTGCTYLVAGTSFDPTFTDNCAGAIIVNNKTNSNTLNGAVLNAGQHLITWTATDAAGNKSTWLQTINIVANISATITDTVAFVKGTDPNTIYIGYAPASVLTYTAKTGSGTFFYKWTASTNLLISGANNASTVKVTANTLSTAAYVLTLQVTNASGCTITVTKTLSVTDVRCGAKLDKVTLCAPGNKATCVTNNTTVSTNLMNGYKLGVCNTTSRTGVETPVLIPQAEVFPNPANGAFNIRLSNFTHKQAAVSITDMMGKVVATQSININASEQFIRFDLGNKPAGVYNIQIVSGTEKKMMKVVIAK